MLKASIACILCLPFATAALALDERRPEVTAFIDEMARDHAFERAMLEGLFAQTEIKQPILDAISRPAERVIPWFEYRERFLTEKRIHEGADFLMQHRAKFARIGDPGLTSAVLGILGVETSYGRITGRYRVIDALATLAFEYPPRAPFFREELKHFLMLTREEAVDPKLALGSYAGAMGAPQFISSSYRKYAVDADGDGQRNLWSSWDDVIGSVANYLRAFGWRSGEPVVVAAQLKDDDLSRFDVSTIQLNETVQSLREKDVQFETSLPPEAPAMLIVAQGRNGPEYRVGFTNFYVITRYNRSTMYSMAVHDLGNAVQNFIRDAN